MNSSINTPNNPNNGSDRSDIGSDPVVDSDSMDRRHIPDTLALHRPQQHPSCYVQIDQAASNKQPIAVLVQPTVTHLGKA